MSLHLDLEQWTMSDIIVSGKYLAIFKILQSKPKQASAPAFS